MKKWYNISVIKREQQKLKTLNKKGNDDYGKHH